MSTAGRECLLGYKSVYWDIRDVSTSIIKLKERCAYKVGNIF